MKIPGNAVIRDFMDRLTSSTNVSKYVDLPMIAVMGDTSSGKSSLLSSISMVELPSNSELTTRCPIMLQMTNSETKRATVGVKWRQVPEGKEESMIKFPEKIVEESNWETLPEMINLAQKHIIEHTGKEVARDIVSVMVCGPDCHDLTLIDLPGIVRSRGMNESATIVEDIDSLIEDYLHNSRCVILAVNPANIDFHNSQIMADAKKVDPETSRTIPVITKPDLIDAGGEKDVLDLLLGNKMEFALGFHMVKGRGQAALDKSDSIETGLSSETSFFENTQPWRDVNDRSLFGTEHLRRKLGDLQVSMIRRSIPDIMEEIKKKADVARDYLQDMGQLHTTEIEKRIFYQNLITEFVRSVNAAFSGKHARDDSNSDEETVPAALHDECNAFMVAIKKGRLANISKIEIGTKVLVMTGTGETPGEVVRIDRTHANVEYKYGEDSSVSSDDETEKIPMTKIRRDPSWLVKHIKKRRTCDVPCFLNARVFESMIHTFIEEDWKSHCMNLVDRTERIVKDTLSKILSSCSKSSRYEKLKQRIQKTSEEVADKFLGDAREKTQQKINLEKIPYCQDHYLFENISKHRSQNLHKALKTALGTATTTRGDIAKETVNSIINGVFERNERKSVDDHMAEDMEIILRSYGKVAMKRIIDSIPQICFSVFLNVGAAIEKELWSMTDAELDALIQDSPGFVKKQSECSVKLRELDNGLQLFESLL